MKEVNRRSGKLRQSLMEGRSVPLIYRDYQYATALPTPVLNKLLKLAGDKGRQLLEDTLIADDTPGEAMTKP